MDNFWLIAIIVVALSLFQKTKRPQEGNTTPQEENPQEEWERRLRELFGEKAPSQNNTPNEIPPVANTPSEPSTGSNTPTVAKKPSYSSRPNIGSSMREEGLKGANFSHRQLLAKQKGRVAAASIAGGSTASQPSPISTMGKESIDNEYNPEIGHILEEFSMEKAVIYSEILKPKFEEDI